MLVRFLLVVFVFFSVLFVSLELEELVNGWWCPSACGLLGRLALGCSGYPSVRYSLGRLVPWCSPPLLFSFGVLAVFDGLLDAATYFLLYVTLDLLLSFRCVSVFLLSWTGLLSFGEVSRLCLLSDGEELRLGLLSVGGESRLDLLSLVWSKMHELPLVHLFSW